MSDRPDFLSHAFKGAESSFRFRCLGLLQRYGEIRPAYEDRPWIAEVGFYEIIWYDNALVVYRDNRVIWSDFRQSGSWVVYPQDHEDELNRLFLLDALADV